MNSLSTRPSARRAYRSAGSWGGDGLEHGSPPRRNRGESSSPRTANAVQPAKVSARSFKTRMSGQLSTDEESCTEQDEGDADDGDDGELDESQDEDDPQEVFAPSGSGPSRGGRRASSRFGSGDVSSRARRSGGHQAGPNDPSRSKMQALRRKNSLSKSKVNRSRPSHSRSNSGTSGTLTSEDVEAESSDDDEVYERVLDISDFEDDLDMENFETSAIIHEISSSMLLDDSVNAMGDGVNFMFDTDSFMLEFPTMAMPTNGFNPDFAFADVYATEEELTPVEHSLQPEPVLFPQANMGIVHRYDPNEPLHKLEDIPYNTPITTREQTPMQLSNLELDGIDGPLSSLLNTPARGLFLLTDQDDPHMTDEEEPPQQSVIRMNSIDTYTPATSHSAHLPHASLATSNGSTKAKRDKKPKAGVFKVNSKRTTWSTTDSKGRMVVRQAKRSRKQSTVSNPVTPLRPKRRHSTSALPASFDKTPLISTPENSNAFRSPGSAQVLLHRHTFSFDASSSEVKILTSMNAAIENGLYDLSSMTLTDEPAGEAPLKLKDFIVEGKLE